MAKKKINVKAPKNSNKGTSIDTKLKYQDYDLMTGKVAFESVHHHRKCSIDTWHGKDFKLLIDFFVKLESLTWKEIYNDKGLNFERNKNIALCLPQGFPPDANLCSMRVNDKKRVYGYRVKDFFYIVWFDKNHEVCPQGKSKPYSA